jgi:hypothetical protein
VTSARADKVVCQCVSRYVASLFTTVMSFAMANKERNRLVVKQQKTNSSSKSKSFRGSLEK